MRGTTVVIPKVERAAQQPWPCLGHQKMTLGRTTTATSSSLDSLLPRVPPARPVMRDNPAAMQVEGAAAVAVWFRRRAPRWRPAAAPVVRFIVGAEYQLGLFVIVYAVTFAEHNMARSPITLR